MRRGRGEGNDLPIVPEKEGGGPASGTNRKKKKQNGGLGNRGKQSRNYGKSVSKKKKGSWRTFTQGKRTRAYPFEEGGGNNRLRGTWTGWSISRKKSRRRLLPGKNRVTISDNRATWILRGKGKEESCTGEEGGGGLRCRRKRFCFQLGGGGEDSIAVQARGRKKGQPFIGWQKKKQISSPKKKSHPYH